MGYEKQSIYKTLSKINEHQIYLPAIQRKYVWGDHQIIRLFDSIMRGYPIGTFLFWKVKKETINSKKYSMYEFIRNYHERDMYKNPLAPHPMTFGSSDETIWAALDGQQRLTSLYIALQGSTSRKLPNKQWKTDNAFPKKELYLNLHSETSNNEEDMIYEFKFMNDEDLKRAKDNEQWFLVKEILNYSPTTLVTDLIVPNDWTADKLAMENLTRLHNCVNNDDGISYYEVEEDSIDNVLDIFVRVNSGGTVLSKSDLLFSTIVSHWDKARDEIDDLLTEINKIGEGYKFSNDYIMRCCLYLLDVSVTLKVETFKRESVIEIKNNWKLIKNAIKSMVNLLNEIGFSSENITSYVATMPIVYYIYTGGKISENSKNELKKYFIVAQLKQIFGAASNSALTSIREILNKEKSNDFKFEKLQNIKFTGERFLKFTAEEIDLIFDNYELGAYTFMVLTLLYPNLKFSQKKFHQDHMHPHTSFEDEKIKNVVLPNNEPIGQEKIAEWQIKRNTLPNLQLLEEHENESKNADSLIEWLKAPSNLENVKYLPDDISYDISHFENFISKRKMLMSDKLKEILL